MHAAEQDNWYLANEWSVSGSYGVAYYEDNSTGVGQIYVTSTSSDDIKVYDLNGSLLEPSLLLHLGTTHTT